MSELFPLQEIGSLAKPVWRIQALSGKTVSKEAYKEAEALVKEFKPTNGSRLLDLLKKTGLEKEEKAEVKEFASQLAIAWQENVGLDLVYEPIWSRTWAEAAAPTVTLAGDTIPTSGRTLENRFRFSNAHFRMGVRQQLSEVAALQLGLALRSVRYSLDQRDAVQLTSRDHEERWVEWTPTWGLSLRFPGLELRYRGQVTHGTGRPGVAGAPPVVARADVLAGGILVAPSGPLTLDEVSVVTHQVSIALPLR